jgi:glycosyltransferase involved in cell wall biosynthesis
VKVAHIIVGLEVGGAEKALQRLALAQKQSGDEPSIIALKGGVLLDTFRKQGLEVHVLGQGRWSYLLAPFQFWALIRKTRPDVLHAWMWHAMYLSLFAPRRIPRVWGVRQSNHALRRRPLFWILLKILAGLSSRVSALVYNSNAGLHWYSRFGFSQSNASVIANGFDFHVFGPSDDLRARYRREWGLLGDTLVVGHVSRFHPDKGIEILLKAFRCVVSELPNTKLVMIGKGHSMDHSGFREVIKDLDLEGFVIALGPQDRVSDLLPAMDVCCLSSIRHEGFPNVIGEAMACAVPCIATDLGDTRELIGDCGIIVPPAHVESLADAIKKILSLKAEERRSLGASARQSVLQRFSLEAMVSAYRRLYEQVISRFESRSKRS